MGCLKKSKFVSISHRRSVLISISVIYLHEKCSVRKLRLLRGKKKLLTSDTSPWGVCCRVPYSSPCPTSEVGQTAIKTPSKHKTLLTLQCELKVGSGCAEILMNLLKVTLEANGGAGCCAGCLRSLPPKLSSLHL